MVGYMVSTWWVHGRYMVGTWREKIHNIEGVGTW